MPNPYTARPVPTITPSNVKHLLTCQKRYYQLYVLKQGSKRDNHSFSAFGLATHEVLAQVFTPTHQHLDPLQHLAAWTSAAFLRYRYPSQKDRLQDMDRCKQMVRGYIAQAYADDEDTSETLCTELDVEHTELLHDEPLFVASGRLDRVMTRTDPDGKSVCSVLDYKTGAVKTDPYETVMLLWLLKLAYPNYNRYEAIYDFIDSDGRVTRDVYLISQLKGLLPEIKRRALQVLTAKEHLAEPGQHCTWCPLRAACQPSSGNELDVNQDLDG